MKKRIVYQIDAFTKQRFKGNPAGVVVNADGLDEQQMQQIARELNNSETAFLFPPEGEGHDGLIRYFTPTAEVPICGHATVAAMYARACEEKLESCVLRYKTKIGVLPFEIIQQEEDYQVLMTQGAFEAGELLNEQACIRLLAALGLHDEDLEKKCPIQIVSTGHSKVMIGIKSRETLNALSPDYGALAVLSHQISCNGYFVFTFDSDRDDVLINGRMFAPAVGINEDPVTGNANGPLGAYLVHHRLVPFSDRLEFKGAQGEKIGRYGLVHVHVEIENEQPSLVQIKGDAVVVFRTEIEV